MADTRKFQVPRRAMPGTRSILNASDRAVDRHMAETMRGGEYSKQLRFWLQDGITGATGGVHLNKLSKDNETAHAMQFQVAGVPRWELGMDYDTSGTGNSDWVLAFDYSANAGQGADTLRISPESASTVGTGCKANWGWLVGTPHGNNEFLTLSPGAGVSGLKILLPPSATNALTNLNLSTGSLGNKFVSIQFGDVVGGNWTISQDTAAANDRSLTFFDLINNKTNLFLKSSADKVPLTGFGTNNPQAILSPKCSLDATLYDVPQLYFSGTFNDTPANRAINLVTILNASALRNFALLQGTLGAGSTTGTPLLTSSFANGAGLEATDTVLSVVVSPAGTNQTITRPLQIGYSAGAAIGFLGAAPVVRSAAYTLSGSAVRVFPTDPSVAYTGINNAQAGTPYAQLADLNTLRTAVSTLIGVVRQMATDLGSSSGVGLLSA